MGLFQVSMFLSPHMRRDSFVEGVSLIKWLESFPVAFGINWTAFFAFMKFFTLLVDIVQNITLCGYFYVNSMLSMS